MNNSNSLLSDQPPRPSELEMTIFGPGVGECIVLHLGLDEWVVVDSCTSSGNNPVALEYLHRIGVTASSAVRLVVATHWHDDHILGLGRILRECTAAKFAMSNALSRTEFVRLVLAVDEQNKLVSSTSSASELADILETLESRATGNFVASPDVFAQDGSRLFRAASGSEVWALSPSAPTIASCLARLGQEFLTEGDVKRFKRFSPNDLSVALLVTTNRFSLLLGADLENTASPQFGWKAVLASTQRPSGLANALKVAHHGSPNADHADVWRSMLTSDPIAVVTPYAKLREPLPTESDVTRLKQRAGRAYCTTWPPDKKPPRRRGVDGIVRGATKSRRALNKNCGHVRLRIDLDVSAAEPRIELFGGARQI